MGMINEKVIWISFFGIIGNSKSDAAENFDGNYASGITCKYSFPTKQTLIKGIIWKKTRYKPSTNK